MGVIVQKHRCRQYCYFKVDGILSKLGDKSGVKPKVHNTLFFFFLHTYVGYNPSKSASITPQDGHPKCIIIFRKSFFTIYSGKQKTLYNIQNLMYILEFGS